MKLAYIGTYPPRLCGIGTFTENLATSMYESGMGVSEILVFAMNDHNLDYAYPPEVKLRIEQEQQTDYIEAANFINLSGADACILEHEFGIFGGLSGVYILPLLHRLKCPLITTLHTILQTPSYTEKAILKEICKMSERVVVMSRKAKAFLVEIYGVPREKIVLIPHGVPDFQADKGASRRAFKLDGKKLLLTFGFISRNKGIETVISTLPMLIKDYPDVFYVVLGKTHPGVLRHEGEAYRHSLKQLIKTLKLEDHVLLLNEFVDEPELFKYLAACDIYITPYLNEAQITSGTLTYAMGAGCAVVSTPYWHASELLDNPEKGRLFPFQDVSGLARVLNDLLGQPEVLREIQNRAAEYGQRITWPKIGRKYAELVTDLLLRPKKTAPQIETGLDLLLLPPFSLAHIQRLTDDTGIIQHAKFGIPNLKEGYCLDDNARALLMVCMAYRQKKNPVALGLMPIYLSYIHYMQIKNGTFRNFLSFNRNFLDEVGSEDSFGRTIWALGYLMGNAPNDAYYQTGKLVFFDAAPNFEKLKSLRGIANTIIGICHYLSTNPSDEAMKSTLQKLSSNLRLQYEQNRTEGWDWFESLLAYDNGILPLALLHAAQVLDDKKVAKAAFDTMAFLTDHTLKGDYLSIIGNKEWYVRDKERSMFAQQPIDAEAMVLMYHQAFLMTGNRTFLTKLFTSFMWFLGENDMRMSLYDFETNGCCDGFENYGVNRNQGAESSLAYLISHLTVLQAYEASFGQEDDVASSGKPALTSLQPAGI